MVVSSGAFIEVQLRPADARADDLTQSDEGTKIESENRRHFRQDELRRRRFTPVREAGKRPPRNHHLN
jgi:hypothetical protein